MSEEERLELENDLLLHRTKAQMINMYLDLLDIIEKLKNENEQLHSIIKEVREKVNQYEIICGYYDGNYDGETDVYLHDLKKEFLKILDKK